eukprot:CAMPEP_0171095582 /NCGR_PEP_ID=MMETSP0766_2-20121228/43248_1 /TAXON_ID=439317 /ORGANISM="Gambierdiscus australes, Strain CAWD 149" /LENGTH=236 /DNA_ID=CAMNT_0011554401 /DNA_START=151 /DNA_END=861 /DNA_ORIENTATION=+
MALAAITALLATELRGGLLLATPRPVLTSSLSSNGRPLDCIGLRRRLRQRPPAHSGCALARAANTDRFAAAAKTAQKSPAEKLLTFRKRYFSDTVRNVAFIAMIGGTVAGSWWFTGKWWKLPLLFALPSMLYRLWITRMDTEKLAKVSASVDMKYVATSEKEQQELHSFMCSQCGYTLFPARGREAAFFTDNFKCPMCGAPKSEFFDMSDDDDTEQQTTNVSSTGTGAAGSGVPPA